MTASTYFPVNRILSQTVDKVTGPVIKLGHMIVFLVRAVAGIPLAVRHYTKEFVRLLSDIAWGNGSLVVGGGTAGVAVVLGMTVER